jgi:hypothetical protein
MDRDVHIVAIRHQSATEKNDCDGNESAEKLTQQTKQTAASEPRW